MNPAPHLATTHASQIVWGLITDRLLIAEKQGRHSVVTGVHQDEIVRRLVDAIMRTLTAEIGIRRESRRSSG